MQGVTCAGIMAQFEKKHLTEHRHLLNVTDTMSLRKGKSFGLNSRSEINFINHKNKHTVIKKIYQSMNNLRKLK